MLPEAEMRSHIYSDQHLSDTLVPARLMGRPFWTSPPVRPYVPDAYAPLCLAAYNASAVTACLVAGTCCWLCREYHSLTMLTTSLDCVRLMTCSLLLVPQISLLLQSILHLEVVLGMHISEQGMQQSPMLQQLLRKAARYAADAL